jgi:peptidyl-tRNA hydrolase, PTH1 family
VTADRWLVAGLGNPGREYAGTRHNVGADAVRLLARREHVDLGRNKRVRCEIAEVRGLGTTGVPVVLAVPTTFMNLSGDPIQSAAAWFKVPPERVIVVHDDLDVPVGGLKLKLGGGHAGHNGLRDTDRALGTREYVRVRIGVGRPPGRMPGKDYVLRRPSPADREVLDVVLEEAADAVTLVIAEGLEPAQNRYHSRERG